MTEGLRFLDVSACYGPDREVLRQVSCECLRGAVTAIMGPNGAGKSSLLRCVLQSLSYLGTIELDGQSVSRLNGATRARAIAYVPQRSRMSSALSVYQVVEQGRFAHRGIFSGLSRRDRLAVDQAIEETGAAALAERPFPELSGGEQQRVLLARALATGARTLLLDEPTSALDLRHVLVLHQVLRRLAARGYCILVVLHDLGEAYRYADRVVLLADGRVRDVGPAADVLLSPVMSEVSGVRVREKVEPGAFLEEGE